MCELYYTNNSANDSYICHALTGKYLKQRSDKFKAYLAWAAICIIWGTTYLAIKIGVTDLPPMLFAGFRWLSAGPILLAFFVLRKCKMPSLREIGQLAIVGILLLGIANGLVVVAEQWLPSGLTALLITTLPFWVVLLESLIPQGIKLNLRVVFGMITGFAGVSLILYNNLNDVFNVDYLLGILCLLVAVISWASGSLYSKYKKVSVNPFVGASIQMIIAGLLQVIVGLLLGEYERFSFTTESFAAFAYLFIAGSMIAYGSYIYAISHLPVSFVTTYAYINPVIALVLGWAVLGEELNEEIIFASAIILIGIYLVKKGTVQKV